MIDYKSDIDSAAWSLLESSDSFTQIFSANCRIKDNNQSQIRRNVLHGMNDYPQISINVMGGNPVSRNPPHTFAMNSVGFNYAVVDVPVPCTVMMVCEMKFDSANYSNKSFAAEAVVRSLFMSAYPKFGLPYVSDFSIADGRKNRQIFNDGAQINVDTRTYTLTFNLRPMLSQLSA